MAFHPTPVFFALSLALLGAGCSDAGRGSESLSTDGNTYLIVAELPPGCPVATVDGGTWRQPVGVQGEITAGEHVIKCDKPITFTVRQGTIYSFNNWK